jgi:hypothetical protein
MNKLLDKLGVDETFTKPPKKAKVFNKVKDNVTPIEDYNYMADLLELPKTKQGFKWCLTVLDLANDSFDIEPLKNKESKTTLEGLKNIFKREILTKPKMSLTTDNGTEFMSVFHKYLIENDINHKTSHPYRHKQIANAESLNKQLGRLFNGYMNAKEKLTGKRYNEWTDITEIVREELNKIRTKPLPDNIFKIKPPVFDLTATPKFKEGDVVYYALDFPQDALGNKQDTAQFRMGDHRFSTTPKKIIKVVMLPKSPTFRYMLEGIKDASYAENELMLAKDQTATKFEVKKVIGKKRIKNKIYYLIWWKGYKKALATWESKAELLEDGLASEIDAYEASL